MYRCVRDCFYICKKVGITMKKSIVSFVISCFLFLVLAFPVSAKTIVNVKHDNTIGSIVEMVNKYPHSGFNSGKISQYQEVPNFTAPYRAGSLQEQEFKDAENALKMVRFLGGVPYERAVFTKEYNDIAQHGAVLLASSNQFSHSPSKPSDMSNYFYEVAYRGCNESNISAGRSNISAAVLGFMYDNGSNNIAHVGHRRWILAPGNQQFGIGYACGPNADYGGHRVNMYVFGDENDSSWYYESDSYISWPSAGAFPLQYWLESTNVKNVSYSPWSINLGEPYMSPDKDSLVLTLTRNSDGKVWTFDKNTPNLASGNYYDNTLMHLATDNIGYGITKAIVFRPDPASLGVIQNGEVFSVKLTGIYKTDGTPATLEYDIYFFDMEKYMNGLDQGHVHFWDDGQISTQATCIGVGERIYTCVGCGLTRSEQIPALGHKPSGGYSTVCGKLGFNDVTEGVYYYNAVEWAVNNEITNGYGVDVIFAPDGTFKIL